MLRLLAASLVAYVAWPACFSTPGATPGDRWTTLHQTDKAFKWHAEKHFSALGIESRKPEEMPAEALEAFLTSYSDGSLEKDEMATAELAQKVRQTWKADSEPFWQWHRFCSDIVPYPIRSPQKMPAYYVQQFLDEYSAGLLAKITPVPEDVKAKLVELRKTVNGKDWSFACNALAFSRGNPNDFSAEVAEHFLANFGSLKFKPKPQPVDKKKSAVEERVAKPLTKDDQTQYAPRRDLHAAVSKTIGKYLKRAPVKTDIVYEIESKVSPFTARVTLTEDLRGALSIGAEVPLSFGATAKSKTEAMESAAAEALQPLQALKEAEESRLRLLTRQ